MSEALARIQNDLRARQGQLRAHDEQGPLDAQGPPPNRRRDDFSLLCDVLIDVRDEVRRAQAKHRPQNSPHEGYAILQEEVDELWDEIKANRGRAATAYAEAVQIAAMAVRYILDNQPDRL